MFHVTQRPSMDAQKPNRTHAAGVNAVPKVYNGRRYASTMEARYAERLDLEKRAGIVAHWEPQVRIPLEVPAPHGWAEEDTKVGVYVVDFDVTYASGDRVLVETKGYWAETARFKRRVFEATWLRAHPAIRYRVIIALTAAGVATYEDDQAAPVQRAGRQRVASAAEFRAMDVYRSMPRHRG